MILFLDVGYHGDVAIAAGVLAGGWPDAAPLREKVLRLPVAAPYQPGRFYLRELPCLLAMVAEFPETRIAVVDGYVWLDDAGTPGLGSRLYDALHQKVTLIGIAKTAFRGGTHAIALRRAGSSRPLYITAAGMEPAVAAQHVAAMAGAFRIPTLLRRVDQLTQDVDAS
ncbi:endonuclease V [Verrucomicrobia bacterium LW23]|nr:endonuclease V [Verrucomicrobia bacterium LW23]